MRAFIQFTRRPYEEPYHINLIVAASNGRVQGELEIYSNVDDLTRLAGELRGFPKQPDHQAVWELGSERPEDRSAFSFRLRVTQVASNGLCAVELRLNNNQDPPRREIVEFSIPALPADLDRLADLLEEFGKLQHKVFVWRVTDGELREEA